MSKIYSNSFVAQSSLGDFLLSPIKVKLSNLERLALTLPFLWLIEFKVALSFRLLEEIKVKDKGSKLEKFIGTLHKAEVV